MTLSKEIKAKKAISARHEALLNVVRTHDYITKRASSFFSLYDITEAQYNVLIVLKLEERNLTQVEIGERLIASRPNITSLIDKLEKKGHVLRKKVASDRRIFEIELTPDGKKLLEKVEPQYIKEVEKAMSSISTADCKRINTIMPKIRQKLVSAGGKQ